MKRVTFLSVIALAAAVILSLAVADKAPARTADLFNNSKTVELAAAAARTATTTGTGQDLSGHYRSGVAVVSCGTVSGTTPTNDVTIDGSDDNSTWNTALVTFTQITAANFQSKAVRFGYRYWRAKQTIGGTTPSFTCSVTLTMGDPSRAGL